MALPTVAPEPQPKAETKVIGAGRVDWTARDALVGIGLFFASFIGILFPIVLLGIVLEPESRTYLAIATVVTALVYVAIVWVAARMTFVKYGGGWSRLGIKRPICALSVGVSARGSARPS